MAAEVCALGGKECAWCVSVAGVPACAHPAIGYPIDPGTEMPDVCPLVAEEAS